MDDDNRNVLIEGFIHEMLEWRRQHPTATLDMIAAALDECLSRYRARMLQALDAPNAQGDEQVPAAAEYRALGD